MEHIHSIITASGDEVISRTTPELLSIIMVNPGDPSYAGNIASSHDRKSFMIVGHEEIGNSMTVFINDPQPPEYEVPNCSPITEHT